MGAEKVISKGEVMCHFKNDQNPFLLALYIYILIFFGGGGNSRMLHSRDWIYLIQQGPDGADEAS